MKIVDAIKSWAFLVIRHRSQTRGENWGRKIWVCGLRVLKLGEGTSGNGRRQLALELPQR